MRKPTKGDRVVDNNRILAKKGEIVGFVTDYQDANKEEITDVTVRYTASPNVGLDSYPPEKFTKWDDESSTWVLN